MARWKLVTAHYLSCPGTEWEHSETNLQTGKATRKRFSVPRYLDPKDSADWNVRLGGSKESGNAVGEIIVCHEGKGMPEDIVFLGDPTPDMIPVDEEAKAISAKFEERWKFNPQTDMPGEFSQSLINQMEKVASKPVEITGLTELAAAIGQMAMGQSAILEALTKKDSTTRRI